MRLLKVAITLALFFTCAATYPQGAIYHVGDWIVNNSLPGVQIARVSTESSSATTGIVCFVSSNSCFAYVLAGTGCDVDQITPMMINSSVGAYHITTHCQQMPGDPSTFINVINEFDYAKEAFESGGVVGFVVPLRSGEFHVMRFSTQGATLAIKNAMTRQSAPTPAKKGDDHLM